MYSFFVLISQSAHWGHYVLYRIPTRILPGSHPYTVRSAATFRLLKQVRQWHLTSLDEALGQRIYLLLAYSLCCKSEWYVGLAGACFIVLEMGRSWSILSNIKNQCEHSVVYWETGKQESSRFVIGKINQIPSGVVPTPLSSRGQKTTNFNIPDTQKIFISTNFRHFC